MKIHALIAGFSLLTIACVAQAQMIPGAKPIDRSGAEHYIWGGVNDGWHLVKRPDLSVIEERLQPGTSEVRHYHRRARQFFYVLSGELTIEMAGATSTLRAGQGMEVAPGVPHQARNESASPVTILVSSTPPSHGDRVAAPMPDGAAE